MNRQALRKPSRSAFTLVELMIVLVILGILASVAMSSVESGRVQSLEAVSRVLASDLRLTRSLSVEHNTEWTVEFTSDGSSYEIVHTGSGNPPPPEEWLSGTAQQASGRYIVNLNDWALSGQGGTSVRILGITLATSGTAVDDVAFGPRGGTGPGRNQDSIILLGQRWGGRWEVIPLRVSWITGQVWIEPMEYRPLN